MHNPLVSGTAAVVCALFSLVASAAAAEPRHSVVERIAGPDGGYDYLSVDSQRLYVGREYGVMAIDLATKQVTGKLIEANDVSAVLIIPGTDLMLSTIYGEDHATLFDRTAGTIKARIKTGRSPDAALYEPTSGLVFVMNAKSNDATLIDVKSARAVATIPTGGKPEAAAADGQGRVYINIEDTAEVAVVDVAARKVVRRLKLQGCSEPTGIAYDATTGTLISACHNGVAKLTDARSGADRGSVKVGQDADGAIFDPERRLAYIPCNDGTLTIFQLDATATPRITDVVMTQPGARTAAVDPQTGRIYLAASRSDADGKAIAGTFNILVVAPLASAASSDAAWDIANTGQPYRDISFTTTEGTWMSLEVSPDGRTIVFDLLGDIYAIPATGGDAKLIQGGPAMQRTPSFSPDGRKLLYLSDASGAENAWMSNPDGSEARQITHETANLMMTVSWGADAQTIAAAYIEGRYPKRFASEIRLFDIIGGSRVLVPTPPNKRDVAEPALSRDGRYVYYTERLAASFGIYVDASHINFAIKRRDLATGAVEEVASGWGGALAPQVSPDGKRLAFVRRVMDRTVLFVLDLATNEQRAVYDGLDRDLQASYEAQANYFPHFGWFPDNRHVAIWGKGKLFNVDMDGGTATEIPFRVTARHRITEPLRFQHDLAPAKLTVRAIRHLAPSSDDRAMIFTALGNLWRKELPSGVPARLNKSTASGYEASYAADGRRVVYVEWDDERGSALRIASSNGGGAKTIATSPGVIRQPRFSVDGKRVAYRIQDPDTSMGGGGRAKPGVYWVEAGGGESHFVAAGSDVPQFSPDGRRIYYIEIDYSGDSPADVLRSVTLDGLDKREHARAANADTSELRASPDLRWIAFRDRQQYYVLPYHETGRPLVVSAVTTEAPVRKLTEQGGYALVWSADSSTVHWAMGPQLYRARMSDAAEPPPQSYASVGLEVPGDVPAGTLAFTNARVITMQGGPANNQVIEHGTVVVTGNRIVAVGASDGIVIPEGAKVIDATGKTVMPGLIDAHGHIDCCFGAGSMPQKQPTRYAALAFGVTTNFDPYPNELTSYESTETTVAGITVGPRWIGTGSAIWGRTDQGSHLYTPIDRLKDAENLMARKRAIGGVIIKSYRYPGRAQRQMLVKAGREAGIMVDVEGESQFYNNLTMLLDGHTNLEHNLPMAHYYDDLVQLMALAKAHNTPTLVVNFGELFGENYMYQTTEAWKDPKVKAYVQEVLSGYSPLKTPYGAPPYSRSMTTIQAAPEVYDVGFRAVSRATKKLDDAGVVINAGSHGEVPGLAMHWEMALLAQGGMSNLHILRAATINGASTLGIDEQIGSLEVGKLADIIVLDRNPLEDINNTNSVRYTMVNGRLYDSLSMNEIGNYNRPRTRFYWELQKRNGIEWNEAWGGR